MKDFGVIEVVGGPRMGRKSHFALLEAEILPKSTFCFPCMIELCLLSSTWQNVVTKMPLTSSSLPLPSGFSNLIAQRGKPSKLFLSILRFLLRYFCFDKMHLFKHSLVCTLENVIPFCTEFLNAKNLTNITSCDFCSNNL